MPFDPTSNVRTPAHRRRKSVVPKKKAALQKSRFMLPVKGMGKAKVK